LLSMFFYHALLLLDHIFIVKNLWINNVFFRTKLALYAQHFSSWWILNNLRPHCQPFGPLRLGTSSLEQQTLTQTNVAQYF
jgi:hypothetical protein